MGGRLGPPGAVPHHPGLRRAAPVRRPQPRALRPGRRVEPGAHRPRPGRVHRRPGRRGQDPLRRAVRPVGARRGRDRAVRALQGGRGPGRTSRSSTRCGPTSPTSPTPSSPSTSGPTAGELVRLVPELAGRVVRHPAADVGPDAEALRMYDAVAGWLVAASRDRAHRLRDRRSAVGRRLDPRAAAPRPPDHRPHAGARAGDVPGARPLRRSPAADARQRAAAEPPGRRAPPPRGSGRARLRAG